MSIPDLARIAALAHKFCTVVSRRFYKVVFKYIYRILEQEGLIPIDNDSRKFIDTMYRSSHPILREMLRNKLDYFPEGMNMSEPILPTHKRFNIRKKPF